MRARASADDCSLSPDRTCLSRTRTSLARFQPSGFRQARGPLANFPSRGIYTCRGTGALQRSQFVFGKTNDGVNDLMEEIKLGFKRFFDLRLL
jgi:hypothetical protein